MKTGNRVTASLAPDVSLGARDVNLFEVAPPGQEIVWPITPSTTACSRGGYGSSSSSM